MSYLGFLLRFLLVPILILLLLFFRERGKARPPALQAHSSWKLLLVLVVVALLYTTPWDNYLVATGVWWYNPVQVMGIVFGWVPLEEYLFFILQPILVGLWLLWLARRLPVAPTAVGEGSRSYVRSVSTVLVGCIWVISILLLVANWQPTRYLALELAWALPPIMLQLAFGANLLLRHWRLLLLTVIPVTVYLAAADALALTEGIWTIDPAQSSGLLLAGRLPVEEFLFFLLTTILVAFGLILGLARESADVLLQWRLSWLPRKWRTIGRDSYSLE
jgi:lycopene cyclase domain-containing protein